MFQSFINGVSHEGYTPDSEEFYIYITVGLVQYQGLSS